MATKKSNDFGLDNPAFQETKDDVDLKKIDKQFSTKIEIEEGDQSQDRAQWGNGLEFLMSCIAMSVGLGNIWRFPFTAYENGGGAFLIPYIIVLLLIGRPIYYMEMALGQFSSRGNVKVFEALAPALKGIGYGQLIGTICVATYYCSLMAITIFYLANSFTSELPWSTCKSEWAEDLELNGITCIPSVNKGNGTTHGNSKGSSELWFTKEVLKEIPSIEDGIGLPEWRLTLCLLAAWIITFVVSRRGVQSSGKAAYFLALFPYVVMIALLIRAATLDGAAEGILFFYRPEWSKLLSADVWYAAVTQCFFSLNVGFGSITMYSSYNNFEHNINR
ncbi:PREDICTED: sodium-dependent nutrient amino acid transporter 1-like [Nicrophorus vespilloides]|uniref:Transporter n=1 Tax=Nicrophorus vespilloides TaxID=110193 RepID=A0ABM1M1Y8_NICVS|nr:PREDICTED: sodium-dependent nutrient amino acid transporter 1-like [Nicrophorus vespilloides]